MLKWVKRIAGAIVVLLVLAAVGGWWLLNNRPSLAAYESLRAPAATGATSVRVQWLGVATLLIDDGETALLTDGFFSRPGKLELFFSKIAPDLDAITEGIKRAGIGKVAAVIVNHSHYDHALDAPEVAKRTGARLVGSESTANIGRGWGLPEEQISVVRVGEPVQYGRFTVTLLPSRHSPSGFTGGVISAPLKPPAPYTAYLEGGCYAVLVQHAGGSLLINASAGFEPGALAGVHADVVMLGAGSLGIREDSFRSGYWREVVTTVGAKRVIPIHWDDFTLPAGTPLVPLPYVLGDFEQTMRFLQERGKADGIDIRLPRDWEAMDVWAGLPGSG
jgi:L-ascorbate metabolism protein UlaG (beta-lactamase superfamily)